EISRLRHLLTQTTSDCAALQAHYADVRSLLAPIRRLPSETLADIFASCRITSDDGRSLKMYVERLAQKPLLKLSCVCVRWHGIFLGTPTLW
ncbi:hypothetical protein FB451DRAFT_961660, partial [Mycena latifolia]